ncbi:MAG: hypothetical protein ACFFD4_25710 [Candidatus Odinarchaeota archaeon]
MSLSDYGKQYLLLGLRIGKLIDGYVDSYFGPPELATMVNNEDSRSPESLLEISHSLLKDLPEQGFEEERNRFLEKVLNATVSSLEVLSGIQVPYLELVKRLFDIEPELIDDKVFFNAVDELENLYDGQGTLLERIEEARKLSSLSPDKVESSMKQGFEIAREKTLETFTELLPPEESISIKIVQDAPWSAYNWYLGNYKSRIDVNTDLPVQWNNILLLSCHEGYPGHHTEHAIKEKVLYIENNRFENAILLVHTPEAVISEGIGNTALNVLFSDEEIEELGLDQLCPEPEKEPPLEILVARKAASEKLAAFSGNLAIHAHVDGWTDDQLVKYAVQFGFISEKRVRQQLKFIRDPLWSPYIFNYFFGRNLITAKFGARPDPQDFKTLLTKPVLPSDLR